MIYTCYLLVRHSYAFIVLSDEHIDSEKSLRKRGV
jgi:metallophosphoesterase superfamily enzyme